MSVIRDEHYEKAVAELVADPILQDMVFGLRNTPDEEIVNSAGEPRWEFMNGSNDQYSKRGGAVERHIGGVAEAILKIRKEQGRCHVPAWAMPYIVFIEEGDRLKLLMENLGLTVGQIAQHHPTGWAQYEFLKTLRQANMLSASPPYTLALALALAEHFEPRLLALEARIVQGKETSPEGLTEYRVLRDGFQAAQSAVMRESE